MDPVDKKALDPVDAPKPKPDISQWLASLPEVDDEEMEEILLILGEPEDLAEEEFIKLDL